MSRKKKSTSKQPQNLEIMDKGAVGWMYRYAHKNYWRVAAWVDFDDLVSEGLECYYYVLRHYPKVKDRPHIMRLFQLTYRSRIEDLAKRSSRQPDQCMGDVIFQEELHVPDPETTTLTTLINQAPPQLRAVLALFLNPETVTRLNEPYANNGHRETLNERLLRLTGCTQSIDLMKSLREYLISGDNPAADTTLRQAALLAAQELGVVV
jgi:hypothetical protein